MKSIQQIFQYSSILLLLLVFSSCSSQPPQKVEETPLHSTGDSSLAPKKTPAADSTTLPVEYQKPSYVVGNEQSKIDKDSAQADLAIKVGASIHSTGGPQPLRDILKRLAALKGMNISWASDVDQLALMDVDINANDDFNEAIEHLLRQINYFHEIKGNTLVIKNKETRQFRIAMPFITQTYATDTGGDVLGSSKESTSFKGKINITATGSPIGTSVFESKGGKDEKKTQFDIWANIEGNLKVILDILETSETSVSQNEREFGGTTRSTGESKYKGIATTEGGASAGTGKTTTQAAGSDSGEYKRVKTSRQTSKTGAYFTIDKPVGIVTVTATRDLLDRVGEYLTSLQKELYKQINIEAKIIEVQLINKSDMGIDWSKVLRASATQLSARGEGEAIYRDINKPGTPDTVDPITGKITPGTPATFFNKLENLSFSTQESIKTFRMVVPNFSVLINALKEEGETKVLSNPKISVMNGEPAFITVGRNTAYISKITSTTSETTGTVSYTIDTSSVLSGVGLALTANVMDTNEVVLNLVPVVSRLKDDVIQNITIGTGANSALVGLPVVDVREMSTTVRVKNGEMLIIGGLIDNTNQNDETRVPLLGDIPLVKYLFSNDSKSVQKKELIILLKPTIL